MRYFTQIQPESELNHLIFKCKKAFNVVFKISIQPM